MYLKQLAESKRGSQEAEFLKRKAESARWLIEAIHQRQSTLQRIANEVFRIQQDFLDKGPNFLHPLRMQEVADNVGVHISTVSRAISGKYAQTPRGIFPLRQFFTGAAKSTDGAVESQEGVRQKLQEIVNKEDKRFPLSDEDIVTKFKEAGIEIARRTVTKYRKALRIPSSRQRRAY
jgi:RNA polymerase sigma-54 factor